MIPRLIHRPWVGPNPEPLDTDFADEWAATNPGWELVTWRDDNVGELLDAVDVDGFADLYHDAPTWVHRADLVLIAAPYVHGGVSVGYDTEPLRPIDPLIAGHDAFCTPDSDGFPGQAFFGTVPRHRSMRALLERVGPRLAERGGWRQVTPYEAMPGQIPGPHIDTGPWLFGDVFGRRGERCATHGMALIGDVDTAYPIRHWERDLPADVVERRCRNAYVRQHFTGSWFRPENEVT